MKLHGFVLKGPNDPNSQVKLLENGKSPELARMELEVGHLFFFFFLFTIVDLQCSVNFCCTAQYRSGLFYIYSVCVCVCVCVYIFYSMYM